MSILDMPFQHGFLRPRDGKVYLVFRKKNKVAIVRAENNSDDHKHVPLIFTDIGAGLRLNTNNSSLLKHLVSSYVQFMTEWSLFNIREWLRKLK